MKATIVCDALNMAIWQRKPSSGLIVHSDRGTQYPSYQYRSLLKNKGYIGSMSKKGIAGIIVLLKASLEV